MKPIAATAVALTALCSAPQVAAAQVTGTAPFCLQTVTGTRCIFSTLGACEAAKGGTSYFEQCLTRPDTRGTTGLGQPPTPYGPPSFDLPPPTKQPDPGR
jgi:hypothetical protein